jgi:hypothetical protein
MIAENAIAAVLVALLTGGMLTLAIDRAVGNLWITLGYTAPATIVLAGVLFLLSSDMIKAGLDKLGLGKVLGNFKSGGKTPPKED